MQSVAIQLPYTRQNKIRRIYHVGCLHRGTICSNESALKETIYTILNDDDGLVVWMGDLAEFVSPQMDKRWNGRLVADWVDRDDLARSEVNDVIELLKPLVPKTLGAIAGNHEYMFQLRRQDAVHDWICEGLGIRNLGYSCFLNLSFSRNGGGKIGHTSSFTGCLTHGGSGATTDAGALNALQKWMMQNHADWWGMGHLHRVLYKKKMVMDTRAGHIVKKACVGILTGCYFETYHQSEDPSYGEMKTYAPTEIGYSGVELDLEAHTVKEFVKIF